MMALSWLPDSGVQMRHHRAGALVIHHHPFFAALVRFDADELVVIIVGMPGLGILWIGLPAVVTTGLQAGVGRIGQAGNRRAVDHFLEQRRERNAP